MAITLEAIHAAGGIVHRDGNIFFRDISMLQGLAGAAPAAGAPQGEYPQLPEGVMCIEQVGGEVIGRPTDYGFKHGRGIVHGAQLFTSEQMRAYVDADRAARAEQPAAVAGPALDVTLDEDQAGLLRDMLGDPAEYEEALTVRLIVCDGHSGHGLYVAQAEYQDEGAVLLTALPAQAAPALEAPAAVAVPAGFALVPIEPTQEMLNAGRWSGADSVSIQEEWARKEMWSRMLATITPPPAAYTDDLVALVENLAQALSAAAPDNDLAGHALNYLKRNGLQGSPLRAAEAAPQAPAAPALVDDEQADAYLADPGRLEALARSHPAGLVRALARAMLAAAPQAPAAPVAVPWDNFPAYLIDHCEGQTITEEGLQRALAAMLANPQYATAAPAAPAVDAELLELAQAIVKFNREHGSVLAVHIDNLADLVDERAAQAAAKGEHGNG